MTLWVCLGCTTKYAVGLFRCPRCHGTQFVEEGQPMPKITVHGGPTNTNAEAGQPGYTPAQPASAEEEESSPGTSSSTPPENSPTKPERNEPPRRSPARTTGSRSKKARTGSSSAGSTDGDRTEPTSVTSDGNDK
jgi:hypothetical protein